MAKVTVSIDAELAVEVMVLAGVKSPQDAVELAVRDFIACGHCTEARVATRRSCASAPTARPTARRTTRTAAGYSSE